MAWSPRATDSREAGYIYAKRRVSDQPLHLQKRSGPYIPIWKPQVFDFIVAEKEVFIIIRGIR
jgi:hypothetical protein